MTETTNTLPWGQDAATDVALVREQEANLLYEKREQASITEPRPYDEHPIEAIDGMLAQFRLGDLDRGDAESCVAGALEAGFVLVPLDDALAAGLVRHPDGHWEDGDDGQ